MLTKVDILYCTVANYININIYIHNHNFINYFGPIDRASLARTRTFLGPLWSHMVLSYVHCFKRMKETNSRTLNGSQCSNTRETCTVYNRPACIKQYLMQIWMYTIEKLHMNVHTVAFHEIHGTDWEAPNVNSVVCVLVFFFSAGVGRTGTFIVLDSMLNQAKVEGKVDIWNFAHGMRDRRMKMIQTSVN